MRKPYLIQLYDQRITEEEKESFRSYSGSEDTHSVVYKDYWVLNIFRIMRVVSHMNQVHMERMTLIIQVMMKKTWILCGN